MKQDTTTSRRADRYTRLKKQLAQVRAELKRTKQERAAAISFILTLKNRGEFEQFAHLTRFCDYEWLEREIIDHARAAWQAQLDSIIERR